MNTVIFARGKNIQEQVEHCRAYAESKGYKVEAVIVGQGRELPAIIKGLGYDIDLVLVKCMSRISRNALEGYTIQADLELDCGVLVEVATERPNSEAYDKFMKSVVMAAKQEQKRQARRTAMRIKLRLEGYDL